MNGIRVLEPFLTDSFSGLPGVKKNSNILLAILLQRVSFYNFFKPSAKCRDVLWSFWVAGCILLASKL